VASRHRIDEQEWRDAMTVVNDYSLLECRFRDATGSMVTDLKIGVNWTLTDNEILDQISAGSSIVDVEARFQPESGYEHRMRFKEHGSPNWGSWSAWTTSRISNEVPVPGAGQTNTAEFDAEMRPTSGTPTIASHGYIKIKKLNSGD
jgi:hypothetical protein